MDWGSSENLREPNLMKVVRHDYSFIKKKELGEKMIESKDGHIADKILTHINPANWSKKEEHQKALVEV